MTLLGWSLGPEETIFTRQQAVDAFDLDDVSKNPAVFDTQKLLWMNGEYIRAMDPTEFADRTLPLVEAGSGDEPRRCGAGPVPHPEPPHSGTGETVPEVVDMVGGSSPRTSNTIRRAGKRRCKPTRSRGAARRPPTGCRAWTTWTTESIEAAMRAMLEATGLNARKGFQPSSGGHHGLAGESAVVRIDGDSRPGPLARAASVPPRSGWAVSGSRVEVRPRYHCAAPLACCCGPVVQRPRTLAFQAGNAGSNPVGATTPGAGTSRNRPILRSSAPTRTHCAE